jgi:hypothetical protein
MEFSGASAKSTAVASGKLAAESSYFVGGDAREWHSGVSQFSTVKYVSMYPKIDVIYYGSERELEYDLIVAPSGDPGQVRMRFTGQDRLQIEDAGDLALHAGDGEVMLKRPVAYQQQNGHVHAVAARFVRVGRNEVGIRVGSYDHTLPLIIDPKLNYSTYLGGADDEGIFGIAFDPEGNLYIAGETSSLNFPVSHGVQESAGGSYDAFVSKFDRTGSQLIYSTYLGGSGYDHAVGLAVDASGSAYLSGVTYSPNFPLQHALQTKLGGDEDAFVARLSASGAALIFSTYLGGSGPDAAGGITIDAAGNAFVAGQTNSLDFPATANALQARCAGSGFGFCGGDAFVAEYDPSGSKLLYSTYLGGSSTDGANAVAVDDKGSVYIAGQTLSADFPVKNAYQSALAGRANAFIAKLSPSNGALEYATYLGGNSFDSAQDITVDAGHNIYVTGSAQSSNFPLVHPFQKALTGEINTFVTKIEASGASLDYSTYLGGSQIDYPIRMALDAAGSVSVTGFTYSKDFPVANALAPTYLGGTSDAFVSRFDPSGSKLTFSTYLGGSGDDFGYAISTDLTGTLFVGGSTSSSNLTLRHPFQEEYAGGIFDAFLEKITLDPADALNVLHAGIGNFVLASQIAGAAATPLQDEIALAAQASSVGDKLLADLALVAFEATLFAELKSGLLPEAIALRLGLAGYDILDQINER